MEEYEDARRLMDLLFGFISAQVVRTMAALDLADHLASRPVTPGELAKLADCHEPNLRRLLRAAVHLELVTATGDGRYELASAGRLLCSGSPMKAMVNHMVGEPNWSAFGRLDHTVRTGGSAVEHVFGRSSYEWLAEHPEAQSAFYAWMREAAAADAPPLVACLDLDGARDVVDIGGGNGSLMAALLRAHPELTGAVFDLEAGLRGTSAVLEEAGVSDRCSLVPGDFLVDAPPAGRDAYIIKNTLSDWDDESAVRLLRHCRQAMRSDSGLFVIDMIMAEDDSSADPIALMSDMSTLIDKGMIRTGPEFRELFARAGLRLVTTREVLGGAVSVMRVVTA
ncbi:methyltransferase [Nonomuraea terrae]|uniref:methyltransferase n=1 Tax=Nonomuraea terrae TaxID=2530383 RepID=UPI0037B9C0B0